MKVADFELERWQSEWEHRVDINLAESSVEGMPLGELLALAPDPDGAREAMLRQRLAYTQTNGTAELRELVAALHPSATIDNVHITNGGSEANFTTCWSLLEPGDDMIVVTPVYPQLLGLAEAFGARRIICPLDEDRETGVWSLDLDRLASLVTTSTRVVAICNPGNPSATRIDEATLEGLAGLGERHGFWILSDELYRGSEHDGVVTPSMWGRTERVVVVGGLSKAYGLAGLRLGWTVTPAAQAAETWRRRDYTTIAPTALGDHLARIALDPAVRPRLIERTRGLAVEGLETLRQWNGADGPLRFPAPDAGAFVFAHYQAFERGVDSRRVAQQALEDHSVLVVPGAHFGHEGRLRIGTGFGAANLLSALDRITPLLT